MPALTRLYFFVILAALLAPNGFAAAAKPVVIVTPAGGEFYVIGSQQRVRLDPKTKAKSITLELSRDGGATFAALGTINNVVKDKTLRNIFAFTVTAPASGQCVIRATADGVSSTSSGFSIGNAAATTANPGPITTDQISSGAAPTGSVLSSDGNGGTSFNPITVNSSQISSGPASTGNVLVSDGSGGTAFQSLDGTFVKVAGDNMTGALNVAGTVGIGTTAPRTTLEINGTTTSSLSITAGTGDHLRWVATTTGFTQQFLNGINTNNVVNATFSNGNVRYSSLLGTAAIVARGDGSVAVDGAFSLEVTNITNNFIANDANCVFFGNTASNNITVTLPNANGRAGRIYIFKKIHPNNTLTIAPQAGETTEGAANIVLSTNNSVRTLMSNGLGWFVISQ